MEWYGNVVNRVMEQRQFDGIIKVGTPLTKFLWSDRHAYETIAVKDQKHVTVRRLHAKLVGGAYSNDWEYYSDPNGTTMELIQRNNGRWYSVHRDSKTHRIYNWEKISVKFGIASEYFDYEF